MKVLVIGNGGREHAICWHLAMRSPGTEVYCAPGSAGIAEHAHCVDIPVDEIHRLADFAADMNIGLTIVGPEIPLALGVVNEFRERGLRVFGPTMEAARLESSKVFAKEFMQRHRIPTADFEIVHDAQEARAAAKRFGLPVAMKAEGLAAGKGVLLVQNPTELDEACDLFFEKRAFGVSADRVLVEEFLTGPEVSFIGVSDGTRLLPFATAKDYKRIGEGDVGPNTGGMGAHSPSGVASSAIASEVIERVLRRTVTAMADEGTPFVGFLYGGLMLTEKGPMVLEFNVRLGDPEAQALLLRLENDLVDLLGAGAAGDFGPRKLSFRREAAACIVLAAEGYPGTPKKGAAIEGLAQQVDGSVVFHAGTRASEDGGFEVAGGRVLNVCATGSGLRQALRNAYTRARTIQWPGRQMRADIGRQVLESSEDLESSGIFPVMQPDS